jgi:class 3 adenylate cyclase
MDWGEVAKYAGIGLAGASTLVGLTRYVTQLQERLDWSVKLQDARLAQAGLEQTTRDLENKVVRLTERLQASEQKFRALQDAGNAVVALKTAIDDELNDTAEQLAADACSILVPDPSTTGRQGGALVEAFVFLSLSPPNEALRRQRVRVESHAGSVFQSRRSEIADDPQSPNGFSAKTDAVANFKTRNMLIVPLTAKGRAVGVAEYLNKRDDGIFTIADRELAERRATSLARKVDEFVADPANFKSIGFAPQEEAISASILVSDISNSSELARRNGPAVTIDLMNEYFESLGEIGLKHGGTIDVQMGDGFMMTFNVRRALADHRAAAVEAATEMQAQFGRLRKKWTTMGYPGSVELFNRIGLTAGLVRKAELGHPQVRQLTVMGEAVNAASHLCEAGSRARDTILVERSLYASLAQAPAAKPFELATTGKLGTLAAVEIESS